MIQKSMKSPQPRAGEPTQHNRLERLRHLVKLANGTNAFARRISKTNTQITQMCGPNPVRSIGDALAQEIEDALTLQPGALDLPVALGIKATNPILVQLVETLTYASDDDLDLILALAVWRVRRTLKMENALTETD